MTSIVVAVLIYIASQYALRLVIEPVRDLNQEIAKSTHYILANHHAIVVDAEKDSELSVGLSSHAAGLTAKASLILGYENVQRLGLFRLPSKAKLWEASGNLILLSNELSPENSNAKDRNRCVICVDHLERALDAPSKYVR